ncbi:MAG: S8 family serine peptidase, partial [Agrococcus sp.]
MLGASAASAAPVQPPIDTSGFDNGRYIVVLDQDPMATYRGGLPSLARTAPLGTDDIDVDSPAASAYAAHLETEQTQVASAIGAQIESSLTVTMNGFIADLTAEQAFELARDSRVAQVFPDEVQQIQASPANEYLDLEGLWARVGGVDEAGAGVVVGVLDTGIAPENPLFAGEPLGTTPGAEPYRNAKGEIVFQKGDGSTFTGVCETGAQFTAEDCSTKIVGARYYAEGWLAGGGQIGPETQVPGEYLSPRDGDGHGSHTASTAAGNAEVPVTSAAGADLGTMSGVAPEARIAAYKVCWSGPDPASTDEDGCAESDLIRAIDQATIDGVDVINYSISGGDTAAGADSIAFLGAAAAGVFVAASAGNSGPDASTVNHVAPWYTAVAAASIPNYEATVVLPGDERIPGGSVTVPMGEGAETISGPFVYAGDIPAAGVTVEDAALCQIDTIDPAQAAGMVVLCDRGVNARVQKSQVVADAGGIGMVLVNVTPNSIDLDDHAVPTIHVDAQYRDALLAAADGTTVISFEPGNTSGIETVAPVVAGFSSRGPVLAEGSDILKPDVAAPGVGIIAAGPNPADGEPSFKLLSGTSMAAPHVAGLGAIYLGERPNASPAEIKSALMTTATDTRDLEGAISTDPWAQGAGFVNTQSMLDAGLIYENGTADWYGYLRGLGYGPLMPEDWVGSAIDGSDVNIASIAIGSLAGTQTVTRTVTSLEPGVYTPSVEGVAGVDVEVSPQVLTFTDAGQSLDYTVTFTTADAEINTWSTGFLTWESAERTVRSPIAVYPVIVAAPEWVEGMGTVGETPITITSGTDGQIPLDANGLAPFTQLGADGGPKDASFRYDFSIPEGEIVHYLSLDAADDTADLDLVVYLLDEEGNPVQEFPASTGSADEELLLEAPAAGDYAAFVDVFAIGQAGAPATFELDHVGVSDDQQEGSFRTEPTSIDGELNEEFTYTAEWNGLDVNAEYLGVIEYTGAGVHTIVHVTTGDATMPVPERLAGDDRFETAVEVSQRGYPDGADVVYVAS